MLCEATEAGHASTHAWAEVYLPGAGGKASTPPVARWPARSTSPSPSRAIPRPPRRSQVPSSACPTAFIGIEVDVKLEQLDKPYQPPEQPTLFPVYASDEPPREPIRQRQEQSSVETAAPPMRDVPPKVPAREPGVREIST